MRQIGYIVAVVAAVGIMIAIAMLPGDTTGTASQETADQTPVVASEVMAEAGSLTLDVPDMHCPFACYPAVKKTLEQTTGVAEVALAEQQEDGVIDNRQVIVTYDSGFDLSAALATLETSGFKSQVAE